MAQQIPAGLTAYYYWLERYQNMLSACAKQTNPALYLYKNNLRTTAFMLQGLSRLHKKLHNKKRFTKMQENFKQDEDLLGQIDYYMWLIESTKANRAVTKPCKDYLKSQLDATVANANSIFKKKYLDNTKLLKWTQKKLDSAKWLDSAAQVNAIRNFYKEEIVEINGFIATSLKQFTQVEEQLHEIRRQLRWLSIYPHALHGVIQYATATTAPASLAKFITKAERASAYNKFPAKGKQTHVMLLQKNQFLALSNVIAQLGDLKDEGLLIHGIASANAAAGKISFADAHKATCEQLKVKNDTEKQILTKAAALLNAYTKTKALATLLK
ncbi:MAG: hypothetical protein RL660_1958 [Bacteroidota bacterium]|jgi:hypothetical protein